MTENIEKRRRVLGDKNRMLRPRLRLLIHLFASTHIRTIDTHVDSWVRIRF